MDLNAYPNIAAIGLMKEAKLNKKIYANLQENLSIISDEEFRRIDSEIPYAKTEAGLIITTTAIIKLEGLGKKKYISDIMLNKNIIYVWGSTFTQKMNFIPYDKSHIVHILARNGKSISSGGVHTGGFSKKDITGPIVELIRAVVEPQYPCVLYGWSKEREKAMMSNYNELVQAVDQARAAQGFVGF